MAEPIKRPGAYHVDEDAYGSELVRQPAFWVALVSVTLQAVLAELGAGAPTWFVHSAHVVLTVIDVLSLMRVAKWSPPRRAWTNEERIAHGLPPLVPDVARPIELPPPLPEVVPGE